MTLAEAIARVEAQAKMWWRTSSKKLEAATSTRTVMSMMVPSSWPVRARMTCAATPSQWLDTFQHKVSSIPEAPSFLPMSSTGQEPLQTQPALQSAGEHQQAGRVHT
jgi:hypothetical protein